MKKRERVFWGIFLIAAAALVIINRLGFMQGISIFTIVVGVLLAGCLIQSILYKSATGLLFAAAFLIILFDEPLGLEAITPWPVLLAATLGSIGISIIFPNRAKRTFERHWKVEDEHEEFINQAGRNNYTDYSTVFGGGTKYINSEDFKGIDLKSVFGGMKVYFDNAHIVGDTAVINMEVVFGGIELFLPKEWNVIIDATCVCGGVEEKNKPMGSIGGPTVRLTGEIVFGGATVLYV